MAKLFGSRIQSLRENRDWSQSDLEHESGVAQAHISRLETGKSPNVSAVILSQLADALNTTVDFLLGRIDDPSPYPSTDHPLLEDPTFHRLMKCYRLGGPQFHKVLVDIAEYSLGLPPTRPVLPRTPDEYELPPGCEEPDDD